MSYNPKQFSPCLISFSHIFFHRLGLPLGMTKESETDIASSAGSVAILQYHPVFNLAVPSSPGVQISDWVTSQFVGWPDAPPGVFGLRSIQMASIPAGGHPHGSGMVFALLAFVPRCRGAIGRAWALGGSRHCLALGPAVRPGTGAALAPAPQAEERLVAGGRDVRAVERQMGVLVPGRGLQRCDDRFLLSAKRDAAADERFLTKALGRENHPAPPVINKLIVPSREAACLSVVELKADGVLEEKCTHRPVQYLNNVVEQDHRAI
jgi:hypothetical protein